MLIRIGHGLLIFLILAPLLLSWNGQIWGFRAFAWERMGVGASHLACWSILTTFRIEDRLDMGHCLLILWVPFLHSELVEFDVSCHLLRTHKSEYRGGGDDISIGNVMHRVLSISVVLSLLSSYYCNWCHHRFTLLTCYITLHTEDDIMEGREHNWSKAVVNNSNQAIPMPTLASGEYPIYQEPPKQNISQTVRKTKHNSTRG